MKAIINKLNQKLNATQWFILLWLLGIGTMFLIALFFRLLLKLAY